MSEQQRIGLGYNEKRGVSSDHSSKGSGNAKNIRSWKRWIRNPLKKRTPPPVPIEHPTSREEDASWFSQYFFIWMNPLMMVGYNRPLELMDFPLLNRKRRSGILSRRITDEFKRRVARGDKNALLFALNKIFFVEFWFGGLCLLFTNVTMSLSPIMLKYLVLYVSDVYYGNPASTGTGIGLAIGIIAMQTVASLTLNQFQYRGMICGGMARASLISIIYAKSQVISSRAKVGGPQEPELTEGIKSRNNETQKRHKMSSKQPGPHERDDAQQGWSNGKVTNLMSTDTSRIDLAAAWCHLIWVTPIQIIITVVQLIINIGVSSLAGFGLFLIITPLIVWSAKVLANRRRRVSKITDDRLNLTQEILQGVRFVKYFAWETNFLDQLRKLRTREIREIQFLLGVRNAINGLAMVCPFRFI